MKQLGRPVSNHRECGVRSNIHVGRSSVFALRSKHWVPIRQDVEMNLPIDQLIEKLKSISGYIPLFRAAFRRRTLAPGASPKAIATTSAPVFPGRAPFDAWIEGMRKRFGTGKSAAFRCSHKAGCSNCHSGMEFLLTTASTTLASGRRYRPRQFFPSVVKMGQAFKDAGVCARLPAGALTCMMDLYRV